MAHNLENTLIIGENTTGIMIGSAAYSIRLPISGLFIQIGNSMFLPPDENYFEEYRGFLPDLWVAGDAEETAIALLKRMKK